jgi:hypothetical protein
VIQFPTPAETTVRRQAGRAHPLDQHRLSCAYAEPGQESIGAQQSTGRLVNWLPILASDEAWVEIPGFPPTRAVKIS